MGTYDNKNVIAIPEHIMVRAMEVLGMQPTQEEGILLPWVDPHKLKKVDNVWYKDGRLVITGDLKDKQLILYHHHDAPAYGHPSINKTTQLVERGYWWLCMKNDIMDYIKGCADCQCHKVNLQLTKVPLRPIYPKPEATPFDMVAIDFITKLLESQGYDSILTITDHDCTKAAVFIPCNEEINAEEQQHCTSSTYLCILDYQAR